MKAAIIILTYLILSSALYAQGVYTDPNTGLTIEYSSEWEEYTEGDFKGLVSDDGLINILSDAEDEPIQPEEFEELMQSNKKIIKMFLEGALGDDSKIHDYGTMYFAGKDSYFILATIKEDFDSDELYDIDIKLILTTIGKYTSQVSILTAKSKFKKFLIKAEKLLSGAYFK